MRCRMDAFREPINDNNIHLFTKAKEKWFKAQTKVFREDVLHLQDDHERMVRKIKTAI